MIDVELVQFAGKCKGVYVTQPMDQVVVVESSGKRTKVGFLDHGLNAVLMFHRCLHVELRETIRRECAAIRKANGLPEISGLTVGPPDPRKVKAAIKGERTRTKKSTIWVPSTFGDE